MKTTDLIHNLNLLRYQLKIDKDNIISISRNGGETIVKIDTNSSFSLNTMNIERYMASWDERAMLFNLLVQYVSTPPIDRGELPVRLEERRVLFNE